MPSTLDLMVVCVYLAIGASIFLIGALLRPWLDGLCLRMRLRFDGSEVSRKFAHISCACFIAYLPFTGASWRSGVGIGVAIVVSFLALIKSRRLSKPFSYLFNNRDGSVIFAVGIIFMSLAYFDKPQIFCLSFLILAFADPAAAFIGMSCKSRPFLGKSRAGFCAHFLVATTVILGFLVLTTEFPLPLVVLMSILLALAISCVESLSNRGFDNLTVPLASSAGMTGIIYLIG